jgi:hypothetical protein
VLPSPLLMSPINGFRGTSGFEPMHCLAVIHSCDCIDQDTHHSRDSPQCLDTINDFLLCLNLCECMYKKDGAKGGFTQKSK